MEWSFNTYISLKKILERCYPLFLSFLAKCEGLMEGEKSALFPVELRAKNTQNEKNSVFDHYLARNMKKKKLP